MEEIKKGYKQTDIGVIPEDWENLILKDICWVNQGLQINISDRLLIPNKNSKIYITIQYLNDRKTIEYIDNYNISVCCNEDDILMTRTGNTGIVVTGVNGVFHNNFFKINYDRNKVDKSFLVYYLNQPVIKKIILAKAGTSTIPDLNHSDFYSLPIILPVKSEQTAIATALSDTDALIAALDKKIAKKQQIKQGAMQQLLTGKKRLPGFSGEWVEKKLGELLDYEQPTDYIVKSTDYLTQGIPVLTAGKSFILGYTTETKGVFENTPVIIFDDFTTATKFVDFKFKVKSSAMKILKLKEQKNNIKLIFELMQLIIFPMIDHQRYWISEYSKIIIKIPSTIDEQTAISQILTDMDNEIAQLEKERDKYKELKAGMMQVLLTGRVRLV